MSRGSFIPDAVSRYRGLSPGAKVVYGCLYRYAGENGHAFPAVETLAVETGLSKNQARAYIKELESARFIAVERGKHYRPDGSGGSNVYTFLWHAAFNGDTGDARFQSPSRIPEGGGWG